MAKLKATNIDYSNHEMRVYNVITKRPRSTLQLADAFYSDRTNEKFGTKVRPRNATVSVRCTIESLRRKMLDNNEHYRIEKSGRAGPHPVKSWKVKNNAIRSSA